MFLCFGVFLNNFVEVNGAIDYVDLYFFANLISVPLTADKWFVSCTTAFIFHSHLTYSLSNSLFYLYNLSACSVFLFFRTFRIVVFAYARRSDGFSPIFCLSSIKISLVFMGIYHFLQKMQENKT